MVWWLGWWLLVVRLMAFGSVVVRAFGGLVIRLVAFGRLVLSLMACGSLDGGFWWFGCSFW